MAALYWSGTLKLSQSDDPQLDIAYQTAAVIIRQAAERLAQEVGKPVSNEDVIYAGLLCLANSLGVADIPGYRTKPGKRQRQKSQTPKLDSIDASIL